MLTKLYLHKNNCSFNLTLTAVPPFFSFGADSPESKNVNCFDKRTKTGPYIY